MSEDRSVKLYAGGEKKEFSVCCSSMAEAFKQCSDNEGYGSLFDVKEGRMTTGFDLEPLEFCPWCGERVRFDWLCEIDD